MINPSRTFLLVDDDEDDRELFELALSESGTPTYLLTASSGIEALKMLISDSVRPDIIFLDLNMPMMDGKECLSRLKAHSQTRDIPVIIYSTSSASFDRMETERLGAAGFLVKQSGISELTHLLALYTGQVHI